MVFQFQNLRRDQPEWYWFAVVVLVGLLLRLFQLEAQSLWLDEMTSIQVAQRPLAQIVIGQGFDDHTPPLYYLLLHVWGRIVPLTEVGLRLPSALIDLLNMILLARLSLRFIPRLNALSVLSAYALSPFMIYYSQEGRMYTLAVFFALAYSLALEKLARAERHLVGWTVLSGFLLALGLYTHYYFLFFGCALVALALFAVRNSAKHVAAVFCSGIITVLLFAAWIPVLVHLSQSGGQHFRTFGLSVIPYTLFRFVVGYGIFPINMDTKTRFLEEVIAHAPQLVLIFSLLCVLAYGLFTLPNERPRSHVLALAWIVIIPPLLGFVVSLKIPMLSERYLIIIYPFFLLLLIGTVNLQLICQKAAVGLFFLILIVGDVAYFANPNFGKAQWRHAAEYVSKIADESVIFVEPDFAADVFKYYFKKSENVFRLRPLKAAGPMELDEHFERAVRDRREIILVSSGSSPQNGYSRILKKIAIDKGAKVFPLETGITCIKWKILRNTAFKGLVGAPERRDL